MYNESPHEIESAKKLYYLSASLGVSQLSNIFFKKKKRKEKKKESNNIIIIYYNIAVSTLLISK